MDWKNKKKSGDEADLQLSNGKADKVFTERERQRNGELSFFRHCLALKRDKQRPRRRKRVEEDGKGEENRKKRERERWEPPKCLHVSLVAEKSGQRSVEIMSRQDSRQPISVTLSPPLSRFLCLFLPFSRVLPARNLNSPLPSVEASFLILLGTQRRRHLHKTNA